MSNLKDETRPSIVVIILTFDGRDFLEDCLESVLTSTYPAFRVIVIDNASTDDSLEFLTSRYPDIEILRFSSNVGFSTAYNMAIAQVSEQYVVIMNHDTEVVFPGWIDEMMDIMETNTDCAVVACKIAFRDSPDVLNSLGGMAYWWTGAVDLGFGEPASGDTPEELEPFCGSGAAMLVRRDYFMHVGGFDESFFMYVEDLDLGWRLRLQGLRTLLAPRAKILHEFSPGLGRISPRKIYLVHRNYLRSMLKNFSLISLIRGLPQFGLFTVLKSAALGIRFLSPSLLLSPWKAIAWNISVLSDTLRRRSLVQKARKVSDAIILSQMGPSGFEPFRSMRRRLEAAKDD